MADHNINIRIKASSDGVDAAISGVRKRLEGLRGISVDGSSLKGLANGASVAANNLKETKKAASALTKTLSRLKSMAAGAFAVGSIVSFGKSALKASADFEFLRKGLNFQVGVDETNKLIAQMQQLGETSAYDSTQLIPMARKWINVGASADEAISKMKMIVDAGSAFGLTAEQIKLCTDALTKMSSEGRINAEDMNALNDDGIPAWQLLSEAMGLPVAQLREMSSKGALAGDAIDALMTGIENRTQGAAASMNNTLAAAFANLSETAANSMAGIGDIIDRTFGVKEMLQSFGDAAEEFKNHINSINESIKEGGDPLQSICNEIDAISPKAGAMANTAVAAFNKLRDAANSVAAKLKETGAGNELEYFGTKALEAVAAVKVLELAWIGVKKAIELAKLAQEAFWAFTKRTPYGLVAAAIVAGLLLIIDNWDKISEVAADCWNTVKTAARGIYDSLMEYVDGAIETIKNDWNTLVEAFSHPIDFIVNRVTHISTDYSSDDYGYDPMNAPPEAKGGINGGPMRLAKGGMVGGMIPALANGGQIKNGTPAIVGEAGPEAVIPLRDEILAKIGEGIAKAYQKRNNMTENATDAEKAQMDAEDMLNDLRQSIVNEKGTNFESSMAQIIKDTADKRNQISSFAGKGANADTIKQLNEQLDVYSNALTVKANRDQMNALREYAATAKATYAEATHDYAAQAAAQYELTKVQLDKERQDKEKELMRDADDWQTKAVIAKDYYTKLAKAEEEYRQSKRSSHTKYIQYLQDEGNLAAVIADERTNSSSWDADAQLEGMKVLTEKFVTFAKTAYSSWASYAATIADELYGTMTDSMAEFIKGARSAKSVLQDFGNSVLNMMAKIAAQRLAASWMTGLLGAFSSTRKSGFTLGTGEKLDPSFGYTGSVVTGFTKFAKGGIVTAPTLAMIGEAGENEAVIPLNHENLSAMGGRSKSGGVVVNITNKTDSKVSVQSSSYDEGLEKWVLDVVVDGASRNRGGFGTNLRTALGGQA